MEKYIFTLCFATTFVVYAFTLDASKAPAQSICSWMFNQDVQSGMFSTCPRLKFLCSNGRCVDRTKFCDGRNDCGDNSDERYCSRSSCPSGMRMCQSENKCIYNNWFCDGIRDCYYGNDETNCDATLLDAHSAAAKAVSWLKNQRNSHATTEKWGSFVDKSAVVLYLSSNLLTDSSNETRNEMAYEVSVQLLSRLSKKKLQNIALPDLASYLNAFLVTCLNPRRFHGVDIVRELKSRFDAENSTSPYVLLSLCNAGETMTASDTQKLLEAFSFKRREFWTDVQAVAVMALACASRQPGSDISGKTLRELTLQLKQAQYRNGTVENLQTTALVFQALLSAAPEEDPHNFDHKKAIQQILAMQKADGSFGNFQNTYYVLPVLLCKSLLNVSSNHCELQPYKKDEKSALEDLAIRGGPKIIVHYSLWIGNDRDLERNLSLRVPANTSFYGIMEMAAEIDSRYRFEYVVRNSKPYVNSISGYQDDPERQMFWYYYPVVNGQWTTSKESPADVIAKNNDYFVMWYRSEGMTANFQIQSDPQSNKNNITTSDQIYEYYDDYEELLNS